MWQVFGMILRWILIPLIWVSAFFQSILLKSCTIILYRKVIDINEV